MMRILAIALAFSFLAALAQPSEAEGARNSGIGAQKLILLMAADEANNDPQNPYGYKIAPTFYTGGLFGNREYIGWNLTPVLKSPVQAVPYVPPTAQPLPAARIQPAPQQVQPIVIMPQLPAQPSQPAAQPAASTAARGYWQWVPTPAGQ